MEWMVAATIGLAVILAGVLWHQHRLKKHSDALRALLDGADALEAQLLEYRDRMTNLKALVARLPSDMTAPAMKSINPDSEVRVALQDVLAHRLWIKREGATATIEMLVEAREALRRSRVKLEEQLTLLDDVGGQLERAGQGLRSAYQERAKVVDPPVPLPPELRPPPKDGGPTLH